MRRVSGAPLIALVDAWLRAYLAREQVACCFIYGSVARALDTHDSDLDTFLITATELDPDVADALKISYGEFQKSAGFVPDPLYPLEIRSLRGSYAELASIADQTINDPGGAKGVLADAAELLGALTDQRIIVRDNGSIEMLAQLAEAIRAKTGVRSGHTD